MSRDTHLDTQVLRVVAELRALRARGPGAMDPERKAAVIQAATLCLAQHKQQIDDAEGLAFMKVGRHLGRLKALLSAAGLIEHAVYVERASLPNQRVVPLVDLDADRAPYFSMVLVHRRGGAHVL